MGGEEAREEPDRRVHLLGGRPALPLMELADAVEMREPPARARDPRRDASEDGYEQEEAGCGSERQHRAGGGEVGRGEDAEWGGQAGGSGEWGSGDGMTEEGRRRWLGD